MNRRQTVPPQQKYTVKDFEREFPDEDSCLEPYGAGGSPRAKPSVRPAAWSGSITECQGVLHTPVRSAETTSILSPVPSSTSPRPACKPGSSSFALWHPLALGSPPSISSAKRESRTKPHGA